MLRKYGISLDFNLFTVFDNLQHGVTIQDSKGKVVYVNKQAAKLSGFVSAEELLEASTKTILSRFILMDEKGKPLSPAELPGRKTLLTRKPSELIVRFVVKTTGEESWSHVKSQPLFNDKKEISGVINFFDDLTKIKKTEKEYKFLAQMSATMSRTLGYEDRLKDFARMVVPNFADWCAIDILDPQGNALRLAVVHMDPAKVELSKELWSNYPPNPKSDTGFYQLIRKGNIEVYPLITDEMIRAGAVDKKHLAILRKLDLKSVAVMPLISRGKRLGLLSFGTAESGRVFTKTDIPFLKKMTERVSLLADNARLYSALSRQMQEQKVIKNELEKSQIKFKSVFQSSLIGMLIFDNDGRIREVNNALCVLLDKKPKSLIKKRVSEVIELDNPDKLNIKWQNGEKKDKYVGLAEWNDREGKTKMLEYTVTDLISPGLSLIAIRDITDHVIEQKRREHFLTITGHELKSPLASIKSISQLLKKQLKTASLSVNEYLGEIDNKVDTINRLVNDLMDVTRIRQGKIEFLYEVVNLSELIDELIKEVSYTAKDWQVVKRGIYPTEIITDRGRLTQVLRNLISNAIKYSGDSKKLIINVQRNSTKRNFKVEVQDFGPGIAPSEQPKIFNLYYRSSKSRPTKGLGVGLYISSQIIKQLGGRLNVHSQLGEGARFYFTLPYRPK